MFVVWFGLVCWLLELMLFSFVLFCFVCSVGLSVVVFGCCLLCELLLLCVFFFVVCVYCWINCCCIWLLACFRMSHFCCVPRVFLLCWFDGCCVCFVFV